jgi:hypothetical protein
MGIYQDQVIEAAYLHTKPGCFYIGPFARRVSFASQQYRALDLVASLAQKNKLVYPKGHPKAGKPKLVAVIGAGIAGLTAAAALRGQKCKVHLYERNQEPLEVQREASHRLIHPNISRWPAARLELTTEFPFFDWFAAPCDRVIAAMREEWVARIAPRKGDRNFRFFPGATVSGISPYREVTHFRVEPNSAGPGIVDYDYVFIATGFDEEETLPGEKVISYWTEDDIDVWRASQREVYISGCGDGGLIDALRLVHGDFDKGWLAIRLAALLTGWMEPEIIDAEDEALMAARSLECMNLAAEAASGEAEANMRRVGPRFVDAGIARRLTAFYRDNIVPRLPPAAEKLLRDSLEKADVQPGKVTLVSRQEDPFGPNAAPIHKIMVQQALAAGRITYRRGELGVKKNGRRIFNMYEGADAVVVTDDMGLVVRHGSPANLAGLTSRAERNSLRIRQYMLADYIDTDNRPSLPPPPAYPRYDQPQERPRFISIRWPMAKELIESLVANASVSAFPDRFVCARGARSTPEPLPKALFGIPLEEGVIPQATAL